MALQLVHDVLVAAPGVTALVGQRIAPFPHAQGTALPYVTLQRISLVPENHFRGDGDLDAVRVQLDAWATTRSEALAVAAACRTALQAAGHPLEDESDDYDPVASEHRVIQDWTIWQ